ncbi:MAG: c-type cytochrome [Kiloniellaceae bacterium]
MTAATRDATERLPLTAGALLLMLLWLTPLAPAFAQTGAPADDSLRQQRGDRLDPWNQPADRLPSWDLQNSPPPLQPRAERHLEFIQAGVPLEYRSVRNPYPQVGKAITGGGALYGANCAACHGTAGRGDGDAGLDLMPSPALLSRLMDVQGSVDEYLLWTIAEGGLPFATAMPAFKDRLSEDQIWQIVAYMRAGFPTLN